MFAILLLTWPFGRGALAVDRNLTLRDFAILLWPSSDVNLQIRYGAHVNGSICAGKVVVKAWTTVTGDVVASSATETAVKFSRGDAVSGDVVTGGGLVTKPRITTIGGQVDTTGQALELSDCTAAADALATAKTQLTALPPTVILPELVVPHATRQRVPETGTLGPGQVVVDTPRIDLAGNARLVLVGDPSTTQVIVRTAGIHLLYRAHLELEGLQPEQVLYLVDDAVSLYEFDTLAGNFMATQIIWRGRSGRSQVDGALFSNSYLRLGAFITVNLHPFAGF